MVKESLILPTWADCMWLLVSIHPGPPQSQALFGITHLPKSCSPVWLVWLSIPNAALYFCKFGLAPSKLSL